MPISLENIDTKAQEIKMQNVETFETRYKEENLSQSHANITNIFF